MDQMKVVSASKVSKRFLLLVAIIGLMVTSAVAKGGRGFGGVVILGSGGADAGRHHGAAAGRHHGRRNNTSVKTSASVTWDNRHVDVLDPCLLGELKREHPHRHRRKKADEEEIVHVGVQTKTSEHPHWSNHTPNDGGIVVNIVSRTCPRASFWQFRWIADVFHRCKEPPSRAEVD
ncbi:unnamed protein product [Dovyalis caffra]|uniref:Uncharacterized protein n=1 Tax=Dovyalis caffra TaxID=77055 RepID=A0AAV1QP35_9ROSI|nr:unnamed protein product [Dovyalis caffra]